MARRSERPSLQEILTDQPGQEPGRGISRRPRGPAPSFFGQNATISPAALAAIGIHGLSYNKPPRLLSHCINDDNNDQEKVFNARKRA